MKIRWQNVALLTVAGFINAFGVTVFLSPVSLYDGGFSGTSMLLAQLMPDVPLALLLILLNFPLFLFGYKRQGKLFTIYSLYAVSIYSLGTWLITYVLPIDIRTVSPIAGSDLFLCALCGGLISGLGSGLTIRYGGAIDGIEVLAVTFAKKLNITCSSVKSHFHICIAKKQVNIVKNCRERPCGYSRQFLYFSTLIQQPSAPIPSSGGVSMPLSIRHSITAWFSPL